MEAFQRPPGPQTLWARPVGEGDAKKKRKKKREKLTYPTPSLTGADRPAARRTENWQSLCAAAPASPAASA